MNQLLVALKSNPDIMQKNGLLPQLFSAVLRLRPSVFSLLVPRLISPTFQLRRDWRRVMVLIHKGSGPRLLELRPWESAGTPLCFSLASHSSPQLRLLRSCEVCAFLVNSGVWESSFVRGKKGLRWKQKTIGGGGESVSRRRLANTESRGLIMMMMMSVALARALTDAEQMDPLVMHCTSRVQVAERHLEKVWWSRSLDGAGVAVEQPTSTRTAWSPVQTLGNRQEGSCSPSLKILNYPIFSNEWMVLLILNQYRTGLFLSCLGSKFIFHANSCLFPQSLRSCWKYHWSVTVL